MLNVAHSHVYVEIELVWYHWFWYFYKFLLHKLFFSILHVSRDCKRFLTASVRHLFSVVCCKKGHCLETVKFNGCTRERPQYSRDLLRAKTLANWLYCNVRCHVFRNRRRKI